MDLFELLQNAAKTLRMETLNVKSSFKITSITVDEAINEAINEAIDEAIDEAETLKPIAPLFACRGMVAINKPLNIADKQEHLSALESFILQGEAIDFSKVNNDSLKGMAEHHVRML
jgi:hypothetical protein